MNVIIPARPQSPHPMRQRALERFYRAVSERCRVVTEPSTTVERSMAGRALKAAQERLGSMTVWARRYPGAWWPR